MNMESAAAPYIVEAGQGRMWTLWRRILPRERNTYSLVISLNEGIYLEPY